VEKKLVDDFFLLTPNLLTLYVIKAGGRLPRLRLWMPRNDGRVAMS